MSCSYPCLLSRRSCVFKLRVVNVVIIEWRRVAELVVVVGGVERASIGLGLGDHQLHGFHILLVHLLSRQRGGGGIYCATLTRVVFSAFVGSQLLLQSDHLTAQLVHVGGLTAERVDERSVVSTVAHQFGGESHTIGLGTKLRDVGVGGARNDLHDSRPADDGLSTDGNPDDVRAGFRKRRRKHTAGRDCFLIINFCKRYVFGTTRGNAECLPGLPSRGVPESVARLHAHRDSGTRLRAVDALSFELGAL